MPRVVPLNHHDLNVAQRIVSIQRRAYAVEAALIGYSNIPPLAESTKDVQALDLEMLAVMTEDKVVALLGYRREGGVVDIDRLAVDPDYFRRGYARLLLDHLDATSADATITVSTGAANTPAVRLYSSMRYDRLEVVELPEGVVIVRFARRAKAEST